ncbi:MAG: DUF2207 domain-containing protein [Anaerolineae bacterium]|nr:DUF2207 domain-containing protein [Anaerolineae bacterium]
MKPRHGLAVVVLTVASLLWASPVLAGKHYSAEVFDVVLDVQEDGALVVTETVRFRFEGGPFTYAFRDLAYTELDEIDRLQASMDGATLPQGTEPGEVEVVAGRPLKVTWHFAPTSDSVHEFVLTYRVQGVIRKEIDADALIWRAIPEEHDYEIERSTITLHHPASIGLVGVPQLSGVASSQESGDGWVRWSAGGIGADDSLVVTARFAPGSLVKVAPAWQARQAEQQQVEAKALRTGLTAGLLSLAAGLAALAWFVVRQRRAAEAGDAPLVSESMSADETPPGMAVMLTQTGMPALATLFDLAGRGVLRIEEGGKGLFGTRRYSLSRVPTDVPLRPHEEGLLRAVFEERSGGQRDSLPLSQVGHRVGSRNKWYREPLKQDLEGAGWYDARRKTARDLLMAVGVVAILVGGAVAVGGLILAITAAARGAATAATSGAVMAGVGAALFPLGLVGLVAGSALSPLSEAGKQAAATWKGFAADLKNIIRQREFVGGEELFERYLPFAAGFGLGERWAKHFQKHGYSTVPAWFRSLGADGRDFNAVVVLMASTHNSFSSGGGGAAGAAGASGGGASGAG